MPYFQNPLDAEFQGNLLLSDRNFTMTFKIKGNLPNSNQLFQCYNFEPYNLSTNNTLTLNYSFDAGKSWTALAVNVDTTATSNSRAGAALASDVVTDLNNNATFAALFTASVQGNTAGQNYVIIQSTRPREQFKVYTSNTSAEEALRFNKKAGVAELPSYFARHTIANVSLYPDSCGLLVQLDPTTTRDQAIIQQAGFAFQVGLTNSSETVTIGNTTNIPSTNLPFQVGDSVVLFNGTTTLSTTISSITANTSLTVATNWTGSTGSGYVTVIHADYQLLRGRSGLFQFQIYTNDTSGNDYRPLTLIEYPAGALAGDLAMKTIYQYPVGSIGTIPSGVFQIPYVLTSTDLVVP
jgi:hypothetical protein